MKRIIVCIFTLLLLVGCTKNNSNCYVEEPKKIEELSDKYVYSNGICLASEGYLIYKTYNRDDLVEVIAQDDYFCYVQDEDLILAIDKNYLRDINEKFEVYEVYTTKTNNVPVILRLDHILS